ncbi:GGDEF domain-containing protein [Acinetobacter bouvetii]|uniref:diguanylate cyclase n=1 Tax=Acinetobacter bouvetii TaxID=202951 RepID=A0A811GE51_9GAMM|nr:GGDEF domain-containing protein [Acinetobacter bouvetii]CAB1220152.1 Response regulator PleD [Acinetobacter bouvetii]
MPKEEPIRSHNDAGTHQLWENGHPYSTAAILPKQLCNIENKKAIKYQLQNPTTLIPEQFQQYYLDYQNKHQRHFLKCVNLIGQLTFLCYFFVDWVLLPEVGMLSGIMRLSLVLITVLINWLAFRYCKNIKVLDSLLPVYVAIGAAVWLQLLLLSHSPVVHTYIYAAVIFILLGSLCIQVSFRNSIFTSALISTVIFQGVIQLVSLEEVALFFIIYTPVLLLSMYISWNNTLNSKRNFLRALLNDWSYYALTELAHTDELTQLNNRRQFMQVAEQAIHKWPRYNLACLLMFDIDFFKNINDTYGHDVGDEVLRVLADIARREMRYSDVLARFGGEEFIALLPNTTLEDAIAIANRLCRKIEGHQICIKDKFFFNFSVSIGVSQLQPHQNDLNLLIKNADIALYQAKKNGRNQVAIYTCKD